MASLSEIALIFLRLGAISFGGPAAHIGLMRDEFVDRRGWLSDAEFLDLMGATNLIPGPNSTELAIHIGHRRAGWPGLVVAGACFIIPAALIVWMLAILYVRVGSVPSVQSAFYGITPVVVAIVGVALWRLAATALRTRVSTLLAIVALAGAIAGLNELLLLALCGVAGAMTRLRRPRGVASIWMTGLGISTASHAASGAASTLGGLFVVFAKAGAFLFGSGYVLLAFLRADLVQRLGWLTDQQLLDAISIGQFTPGPVFTTATFIGYILHGSTGALVATAAIFLPAFFFVAVTAPFLPRLRASATMSGMLDGVNAASLALMAVVTMQIAGSALIDGITLAFGAISALVLLRTRVNPAWLIGCGAVIGVLLHR